MSRLMFAAAVTGLLLAVAHPALAQYPVGGYYAPRAPLPLPGGQPALSPYLNLLRGGNPAANYYLGVVPEVERRANVVRFTTAIDSLQQQVTGPRVEGTLDEAPPDGKLTPTGHAVTFMNASPYFGAGYSSRVAPFRRGPTAAPRGPRR